MKRSLFVAYLMIAAVAAPELARAQLVEANAALAKGEYKVALEAFQKAARGKERGLALLGQVTALRRVGRYVEAERIARQAVGVRDVHGAAVVAHAEVLGELGRSTEAIRILEQAAGKDEKNFAARARLGRLYNLVGQKLKADVIWKDLFRDWDNGVLDKKRADHTFFVGMAGEGDQNPQFASDAYEAATKLDPKLYEVNVTWGLLFLSKYNVPDAERCFQDVLKHDPNHADAWAGLAWVEWHAARPDKARGKKHAEKALAINPNQVEAMLYLASMHIYDAEYGRALIFANRALGVNPNHLRALAHLASIHYLREKTAEYRQVEALAKKVNPLFSDFYVLVARFANRHHLYDDAVKLNKQAKDLDANNASALAALGVALLRTGNEGEGIFWLKEAWKVDKFNHQTLNLLNLYDDIAKKFTTLKAGGFELKVPKDELAVIRRYLPEYLNQVLAEYKRKYGWTPKGPIKIELYDSQKDFTVRTFGEPVHGGILGVCFGHLITALSPSLGSASWAMVLRHELAHTVHIHLSRNRVPRWFTEGLAELETIRARAEWKREHALDLHRALVAGTAEGVERLNYAFTHAKSSHGMVIAYYQSSQVLSFLEKRWGYAALNKALRLYSMNKTTAEVIPAITGLTTAEFDKRFKAWFLQEHRHYQKGFDPYAAVVVPLEELEKRAKAAPKDARAQANLAVGLFARRQAGPMGKAMEAAKALDPKEPVMRFLEAELAAAKGDHGAARTAFEGLRKGGSDGYAVRMRLGALAAKEKQWPVALGHYQAAKGFDPERVEPFDARIRILAQQKKDAEVLGEMIGLAALKEGDGSLHYSILVRADKLGRHDIVRRFGQKALEIQPMNLVLHEKYAWALKAGRQHRQAIFEFESALASIPETMPPEARDKMRSKEAWLYLGKAETFVTMRELSRAREALSKALERDSNFARALELRRRISPGGAP
ncbi:MAG: tetratricopeptide repeat protein [Polyangia bacterium]|jgi:tetratricopeptide (TPR) repeat protein|nr:tetratricopeptide repeat protein [Polyangia bacterium]